MDLDCTGTADRSAGKADCGGRDGLDGRRLAEEPFCIVCRAVSPLVRLAGQDGPDGETWCCSRCGYTRLSGVSPDDRSMPGGLESFAAWARSTTVATPVEVLGRDGAAVAKCLSLEHGLRAAPFSGGGDGESARLLLAGRLPERVADPRGLLLALRRRMRAGDAVWLELSGRDVSGPLPPHRFSVGNFRRLAARCGFASEETGAAEGTAALVLRRVSPPTPAALAQAIVTADARRITGAVCAEAQSGHPVALWGAGTDFSIMTGLSPALAGMAEDGRVTVFDRAAAGRPVGTASIRPPEEAVGFPGRIYLTPSSPQTRASIRDWSTTAGIDQQRLVDLYGHEDMLDGPVADREDDR